MATERYRIGDICDVRWGDTKVTKSAYIDDGFTAYSASGPDGFLPYADYAHPGIVLSAIGAQAGRTWLAKGEWSCIKNTIRILATSDVVSIDYLYWATRKFDFWPIRGSAQPFISQTDARNVYISLPSLASQKAIAEVLGALDDKIAANTRIARTFESLGSAKFSNLRLDVEPTDSAATLDELFEFNPRRVVSSNIPTLIDMQALPTDEPLVSTWRSGPSKGGTRFANGDTLLARITPCLENRKTAFVDFMEGDDVGIGSTEFIVIRSKNELPLGLSYFMAVSERFREFAIQNMAGTSGRQRVAAADLARHTVNRIERSSLVAFGAWADAILLVLGSLRTENQILEDTRDALLPSLLSGKLRITDAEVAVSAVV